MGESSRTFTKKFFFYFLIYIFFLVFYSTFTLLLFNKLKKNNIWYRKEMPTFTQKSPQGSEKGSEGQVRLTHSPASTISPAATPSPASKSKPSSSSSAAPASKEPMFTVSLCLPVPAPSLSLTRRHKESPSLRSERLFRNLF